MDDKFIKLRYLFYHMKDFEYYNVLGEETFFFGMTNDRLQQVALYRVGKSFRDFAEAVKQGRLEGLGIAEIEFSCIASKIYEVVEIDVKEPLYEFERRLADTRQE